MVVSFQSLDTCRIFGAMDGQPCLSTLGAISALKEVAFLIAGNGVTLG